MNFSFWDVMKGCDVGPGSAFVVKEKAAHNRQGCHPARISEVT